MNYPNMGYPNMGHPNMRVPNMGHSNMGNPTMGNPNMGNRNTVNPNVVNPNVVNPNVNQTEDDNQPAPLRYNEHIEEFVAYLRDRPGAPTDKWRRQMADVLQTLAHDYHQHVIKDNNPVASEDDAPEDENATMDSLWHDFFVKSLKKLIRSYPANKFTDLETAVDQLRREEIELKAQLECGKVVFHPNIPHKYMNHPHGEGPAMVFGHASCSHREAKPKVMKFGPDRNMCNKAVSLEIRGCPWEDWSGEGVTTVRITIVNYNVEWVVHGPATLQLTPHTARVMVTAASVGPVADGGDVAVVGAATGTENAVAGQAENRNKKRKIEVISEEEL